MHPTPQVFVDDVLVYSGNLERSPDKEHFANNPAKSGQVVDDVDRWRQRLGAGRGGGGMDLSQTILFTNDPFITQTEVSNYVCNIYDDNRALHLCPDSFSCRYTDLLHTKQIVCNFNYCCFLCAFASISQADRVPFCDDLIEFIDEGTVKVQDMKSSSIARPMTSHTGRRL